MKSTGAMLFAWVGVVGNGPRGPQPCYGSASYIGSPAKSPENSLLAPGEHDFSGTSTQAEKLAEWKYSVSGRGRQTKEPTWSPSNRRGAAQRE